MNEPSTIAEYHALANRYAQEGQLLKALEVQQRIREIDPTNRATEHALAGLYAKRPQATRPPEGPPAIQMPVIPLFSDLTPAAFVALTQSLRVHRVRPGQTIVREGDSATSMFAIVHGSVNIERDEHGANVCLATMGEGDFFGEMGLISDAPRLATVRAREEAALLEVMRDRISQITAKHPSVGQVLERFYRRRLVINVLRSNPMLRPLFQTSLQELMSNLRSRALAEGTMILEQGTKGRGFYVLLRGECVVTRSTKGTSQIIAQLREGDVFGEISLLLDRPVTATVTAGRSCFVLRLSKEVFDAAIAKTPEVRDMLAALGSRRLEELGESSRPVYNV